MREPDGNFCRFTVYQNAAVTLIGNAVGFDQPDAWLGCIAVAEQDGVNARFEFIQTAALVQGTGERVVFGI